MAQRRRRREVKPDEPSVDEEPWEVMAYLGRHMHQPMSEIGNLTMRQAWRLVRAVGRMIKLEHPSSDSGEE